MNSRYLHYSNITNNIFILILMAMIFTSCHTNDSGSSSGKSIIKFNNSFLTIDENASDPLTVTLSLSENLSTAGMATISIKNSGSVTSGDYTTNPEASSGAITLNFAEGDSSASFSVTPVDNSIVDNDKTIFFTITSVTGGIKEGTSDLSTTVVIKDNEMSTPSIAASTAQLDDFGNVDNGSVSSSKSYTVTGSNLNSDISVTASDNFLVSLDDTTFTSSVNIDSDNANNGPTNVYVQFAPSSGLNSPITGTITQSSDGADDVIVNVSGKETGNASASLLFNEDFDYGSTAGDLVSLSDDWVVYSGSDNPVQYITSGLSFTGYGGSDVGGAVTFENGSGSRQDVKRPISVPSSGTIYIAQLLNLQNATANENGDFFFSLRTGSTYFNRLYAKDDGSGNLLLGISRTHTGSGDTAYDLDHTFSYGTTYLVVIKYDFSTKESSLFVLDSSIPSDEPTTPNAVAATGAEPDSFEVVLIRQSSKDITGTIDGIRIATTWKDALGL